MFEDDGLAALVPAFGEAENGTARLDRPMVRYVETGARIMEAAGQLSALVEPRNQPEIRGDDLARKAEEPGGWGALPANAALRPDAGAGRHIGLVLVPPARARGGEGGEILALGQARPGIGKVRRAALLQREDQRQRVAIEPHMFQPVSPIRVR